MSEKITSLPSEKNFNFYSNSAVRLFINLDFNIRIFHNSLPIEKE